MSEMSLSSIVLFAPCDQTPAWVPPLTTKLRTVTPDALIMMPGTRWPRPS
jgi:hypothetical protein